MSDMKLGNVWGRISSVTDKKSKKGKGNPYLFIAVECGNERLGQVKTFGRVFGESRVADFKAFHKANAGKTVRLTGFFSQYTPAAADDDEAEANGRKNSNYIFAKWQEAPDKELKAAFVLKGKVTAKADGQGLKILVVTEAKGDYEEQQEEFEVYLHPETWFDGYNSFAGAEEVAVGHQVQASGYLRTLEPEDEFGMPSSDIRPYVTQLKLLEAF